MLAMHFCTMLLHTKHTRHQITEKCKNCIGEKSVGQFSLHCLVMMCGGWVGCWVVSGVRRQEIGIVVSSRGGEDKEGWVN